MTALWGWAELRNNKQKDRVKIRVNREIPPLREAQGQDDSLRIRGESIAIREKIAYVGEDKGMYPYMTVGELIWFTRSFYSDWRPEVEKKLLADYRLPRERKVKALSKGMRTKLALLLALARRPALLIYFFGGSGRGWIWSGIKSGARAGCGSLSASG